MTCSRKIQTRCADPASIYFTKEVMDEQCDNCRRLLNTAQPTPKPPSLPRRIITYAEAVVKWIAAGRPERSDEETLRIFHQFCQACNWYDYQQQICRGCGCNVNDYGHATVNKIKMATEHCPRNLW